MHEEQHSGSSFESNGWSLRDVRAERLMSRRELAVAAGVAPNTIYLIERGRSTPQLSIIRRLAAVLCVDAQDVTEFRRAIRAHGDSR